MCLWLMSCCIHNTAGVRASFAWEGPVEEVGLGNVPKGRNELGQKGLETDDFMGKPEAPESGL